MMGQKGGGGGEVEQSWGRRLVRSVGVRLSCYQKKVYGEGVQPESPWYCVVDA